ncbi:MAG: hypothetical protein NT165_02445 [Candidatus Falkowbacteria bacterium]|nr:hypothetical protein [Candidatus Falkowbacteria bacterium]
MFNPSIFKAYDLRGVFGVDFDPEFSRKLGLAFVALRKQELSNKKLTILVASDMRLSSPEIKEELIKGLREAGADVIDAGVISTPTFYFAVSDSGADGGIIVSASHNPKEWNGFKIVRNKALPVSGEDGLDVLKKMITEDKLPESQEEGMVTERQDFLDLQIAHDFSLVDKDAIKPMIIALDPAWVFLLMVMVIAYSLSITRGRSLIRQLFVVFWRNYFWLIARDQKLPMIFVQVASLAISLRKMVVFRLSQELVIP